MYRLAQQTNPEGASATERDFVQEHYGANNGSISSASRSRGGQSTRTSDLTTPGRSASSNDNSQLEESVRAYALLVALGDKVPASVLEMAEKNVKLQFEHQENKVYVAEENMHRAHYHSQALRNAEYAAFVNASSSVSGRSSGGLATGDLMNTDTFVGRADDQWGRPVPEVNKFL